MTPAPTAVTVFVGYTNPFWLSPGSRTPPPFGAAVELFSFADYQVALKAGNYFDPTQAPPANNTGDPVVPAQAELVSGGNGFTFTALQPVGVAGTAGIPMTVTLSNITTGSAADDTADLTIVYGTRVETYRRVSISALVQTVNSQSSVASVTNTGVTPSSYDGLPTAAQFTYATVPHANWTVIDPTAFAAVFAANAPLDKVAVFNLMALPGLSDPTALAQALAYCETKRAFLVMDAPANAVADRLAEQLPGAPSNPAPMADIWNGAASNNPVTPAPPVSTNGAIYFPYLQTTDPVTGAAATSPPSGFVTGIFAREDNNRGVWKSPAGLETTMLGTTGVVKWGALTDPAQGVLNRLRVNCVRTFPGIGSVVFGARTLVSDNPADQQWMYVGVRRMALFIEQPLYLRGKSLWLRQRRLPCCDDLHQRNAGHSGRRLPCRMCPARMPPRRLPALHGRRILRLARPFDRDGDLPGRRHRSAPQR